ncbi:MAG: TIGR04255 family protein [Proteobacteria bacterium]|nr:TIGR04255 family protein [Pseudomonadota bacterium]
MTVPITNRHVDFEKPPVVEVVCGVVFEPIEKFSAAHYGLLWKSYADEFPKTSDQPRLPFPIAPGQQIKLALSPGVQLPRVWFVSEDERQLIQVQSDRFNFNWRRREEGDNYPEFPTVYQAFWRHFETFHNSILGEQEELKLVQYELTYINHIPVNEVWQSLGELGKVLPDMDWKNDKDRFLPPPVHFSWEMQHPMPGGAGTLAANASSARMISTGELAITLNLAARGTAGVLDVHEWYKLAHEWITKGFVDLTGHDLHNKVWFRKEVDNG